MAEEKENDLKFTYYDEKKVPYKKIPLCALMRELLDGEEEKEEDK